MSENPAPEGRPSLAQRFTKNSDQSRFWERHEFTRAVKSLVMCLRFSARGVLFAARRIFPQAVQRGGRWKKLIKSRRDDPVLTHTLCSLRRSPSVSPAILETCVL